MSKDMRGQDLREYKFFQADFQDANLEDAIMGHVIMQQISFERANLCRATLKHANISEINFNYANLRQANMSDAGLTRCQFNNVDFTEVDLGHVLIADSSAQNSDFTQANLYHTTINSSTLHGSTFREANLESASINWSEGESTDFTNAKMNMIAFKCKVSNSTFDHASIEHGNVELNGDNVSIKNVQLRHTILSNSTLSNSVLTASDLTHVNMLQCMFIDCDFTDVKFTRSNIANAVFTSCDFSNCDFADASFIGVSFENCTFQNATYSSRTIWPNDFIPEKYGAIKALSQTENTVKNIQDWINKPDLTEEDVQALYAQYAETNTVTPPTSSDQPKNEFAHWDQPKTTIQDFQRSSNKSPDAKLKEIETLINIRQKISAIKKFRTMTGVSLKEAKEIVDHFEAHGVWISASELKQSSPTVSPSPSSKHNNIHEKCASLLATGQKRPAIKEWREHTGASLKDAKEAIEQLERNHSTPAVNSISHDEYEEHSAEEEAKRPDQQSLGIGYWVVLLGLCGYFAYYLLA